MKPVYTILMYNGSLLAPVLRDGMYNWCRSSKKEVLWVIQRLCGSAGSLTRTPCKRTNYTPAQHPPVLLLHIHPESLAFNLLTDCINIWRV